MSRDTRPPKVAIVHDWLTTMGGAEKVVLAMHEAFPDAPIYTSVYEPAAVPDFDGLDIRTTWLQKLPRTLRRFHKLFPVLRVWAFRSLDLSGYDIILSSSSAESKQVRKTRPGQVHICYCHTPIRYYWSHYDEYRRNPPFGRLNRLIQPIIPPFVWLMRRYDLASARTVDHFIANSTTVQTRIKRYYGRDSTVMYPPVDVDRFDPALKRGDYYVALGRQEPYKRIDLAVAAATELGVPLLVFGNGSEHQKLLAMAGPTVSFYTDRHGDASDTAVAAALNRAKGFIFSAEEDFGIVQVEALAAGAAVIAFNKGGSRDIVQSGINGYLFDDQTLESLTAAITSTKELPLHPRDIAATAQRFRADTFIAKLKSFVAANRRP